MEKLKYIFLNEKIMMVTIALSAIVIFVLSFPRYEQLDVLLVIDQLFILLFALEAWVKIRHYGWKEYRSYGWNVFDFILVILSIPSLLMYVAEVSGLSVHMPDVLENIIILRLFRLLRIFRLMDFIPNMGKLLSGIGRALKASTFVIFVLFIFNVILAIFSSHLFRDVAPDYFSNPLSSAYSIFQLFTVEGWYEIPAAIGENSDSAWMSEMSKVYFVIIVLLGGVFGMSLANAIFVDEMTSDNNEALEQKVDQLSQQLEDIKELLQSRKA